MSKPKPFTGATFRQELKKIMPGYKWTVHKGRSQSAMEATGIKASGFNRTSTLFVWRGDRNSSVSYEVTSAGYGKNSGWLVNKISGVTLAQALRGLQNYYASQKAKYASAEGHLQNARSPKLNRTTAPTPSDNKLRSLNGIGGRVRKGDGRKIRQEEKVR